MKDTDRNEALVTAGVHWKRYVIPAAVAAVSLYGIFSLMKGEPGLMQRKIGGGEWDGWLKAFDIFISAYFMTVSAGVILRNAFTSYGVTEKTAYRKSGIVSVHREEFLLKSSEHLTADQGVMDRLLGTGTITLTGTGGSKFVIRDISGFGTFRDILEGAVAQTRTFKDMTR